MAGGAVPFASLIRRLDAFGRAAIPATTTMALMVLAAAPTGLPGAVGAVALPCVVFWSVFRPGAMSSPLVFLLGMLHDLLSLTPLGFGALLLLLAQAVAVSWRHWLARQGFLRVWLAFCGFALGASALGFGFAAVLSWQLPPLAPALHQAALTAGLYPVLAPAMIRAHRLMGRSEEGG